MTLAQLRQLLRSQSDPQRAVHSLRFFKTGPGEYGEGDRFLGLTVPQVRSFLVKTDGLSEDDVLTLLRSEWHEERLLALLVWVRRFGKAKKQPLVRAQIVKAYLANTRWINNWDLVDTSAPHILGTWLLTQPDRITLLDELSRSRSLWEQRIAVLATQAYIRAGEFAETQHLCERFLSHPHDLMHKACGWMLREIGNRDEHTLRSFLDRHAPRMPRTMLRYAIEKLPERDRQHYMARD